MRGSACRPSRLPAGSAHYDRAMPRSWIVAMVILVTCLIASIAIYISNV
jgi:hypothetical protein